MDMHEYISKRLSEIKIPQERETLRTVMEEVLIPLFDHTTEKYNHLEKRIYDELPFINGQYSIKSTVLHRSQITNSSWLFPICEEDLSRSACTKQSIIEAVENNCDVILETLYIPEDYLECKELADNHGSYQVSLLSGNTVTPVRIRLKPAERYRNKVIELYRLFQMNGIPWVTPNLAYCYKFYDVVLLDSSKIDEVGPDNEFQLEYDTSVFSKNLQRDLIPVWNLQSVIIDQMNFPIPSMDKKNYEYSFDLPNPEDGYLFYKDSPHIMNTYREDDRLVAITSIKNTEKWRVIQIIQKDVSGTDRYDHPIFTNRQTDSFAGRMSQNYGATVKTKAELARILHSFEVSEYIKFESVFVSSSFTRGETYDINSFLRDEIRDRNNMKTMILKFVPAKKANYLNRDLMSFLVSQIQLYFPEYNCVGVLA